MLDLDYDKQLTTIKTTISPKEEMAKSFWMQNKSSKNSIRVGPYLNQNSLMK